MRHSLWTFRVTGAGSFALHPPGNPLVRHDGGMSVFHLILTDEQVDQLKQLVSDLDVEVEIRRATEQTETQRKERLTLLGRERADSVYPSTACPNCFWFDPALEGFCGRSVWPSEVVATSLEVHEAARTGEAECPVRDWN